MAPAVVAAVVVVGIVLLYLLTQHNAGFDNQDTSLPTPTPVSGFSQSVQNFAQAISQAEGFGVAGAIPTNANNPGDLVIPNWQGPTLGAGISVFSSPDEGWNRLYRQLQLIIDGNSKVYSLNDTILTMGQKWTLTNQAAWSTIVASFLNVSVDTVLGDVLLY